MGCDISSSRSRGWHAIRKYQGTRRRQRTLTGQGWGQRPPCRCRESRALGSVGFPACRTLRTPGDCRAVEASSERGCRVRLPACTTGSSVWKSTPEKGLSQVRLLPILPAFGPAIEDGRKTTRRTRGEGPRVAPQPASHCPVSGGGLCQDPARPAPAASPSESPSGPPPRRTAGPEPRPLGPLPRCNGPFASSLMRRPTTLKKKERG
jgi:hypothetical protein